MRRRPHPRSKVHASAPLCHLSLCHLLLFSFLEDSEQSAIESEVGPFASFSVLVLDAQVPHGLLESQVLAGIDEVVELAGGEKRCVVGTFRLQEALRLGLHHARDVSIKVVVSPAISICQSTSKRVAAVSQPPKPATNGMLGSANMKVAVSTVASPVRSTAPATVDFSRHRRRAVPKVMAAITGSCPMATARPPPMAMRSESDSVRVISFGSLSRARLGIRSVRRGTRATALSISVDMTTMVTGPPPVASEPATDARVIPFW